MVKLIALYKKPADAEAQAAFEKHYFEIHMALVAKIPGMLKSEVAKINTFAGQESKYFLLTEMFFDNVDKLNEGMASPEGKAAGRDLMSFAKEYVEMSIGEVI